MILQRIGLGLEAWCWKEGKCFFHTCNRCWSLQMSKKCLQNVALGLVFFLHSLHNACMGLMTHNLRFPKIDYIIGLLRTNFFVMVSCSVQHFKNSTDMEFVVTDLANEVY